MSLKRLLAANLGPESEEACNFELVVDRGMTLPADNPEMFHNGRYTCDGSASYLHFGNPLPRPLLRSAGDFRRNCRTVGGNLRIPTAISPTLRDHQCPIQNRVKLQNPCSSAIRKEKPISRMH